MVKNKDHRKVTQELFANFALEGIYPTQETLHDLALIDNGNISPEEFIEYIKEKHTVKE